MIIRRMSASFGKLHDTLELQPGFNFLCLPNEGGKSTWSAFLTAMLYGIDSSERANAANQGLPAKERYRPWDGSPMEGTVELEWEGREITIERKTLRKSPMGAFRAYETASGLPLPELTGENCGRILCGVERSVFERTAFIRQLGMAVTADGALEKRLETLVTTGEEKGLSYSQLESALKTMKNRLEGRTGIIPGLEQRERALRNSLRETEGLERELRSLREEQTAAEKRREALEEQAQRLRRGKSLEENSGLKELEEKLLAQQRLCSLLEETVGKLPGQGELLGLQRELDGAERNLQSLRMDTDMEEPLPEPPAPPRGLESLTPEEIPERAREAEDRYEALTKGTRKWGWLAALALLLSAAALGILAAVFSNFLLLGAGGLLGASGALVLLFEQRRRRERRQEAEALLAGWGAKTKEDLQKISGEYEEKLRAYKEKTEEIREERGLRRRRLEEAQKEIHRLVSQIQGFAPNFADTVSCREALTAALKAHERLAGERRTLELLRKQRDSIKNLVEQEGGSGDLTRAEEEARRAREECSRLSERAGACQGALQAMGEVRQRESELWSLQEELSAARERSEAVSIAMEALKRADSALRSRFSPQITADGEKILAELTEGKYTRLQLQPDMRLSVRQETDVVMHGAAAMSCGTADQMYLALRLAMCGRLLPGDAPLILDDALVNFDDSRAGAALKLLRKIGEKRQILFFTCHKFGEN